MNYLRCVYADGDKSCQRGGRLHAKTLSGVCYQSLDPILRNAITINGELTVELDYAALHIMMLYAKENHQYPTEKEKDPYRAVFGEDDARHLLKALMLIAVNCKPWQDPVAVLQGEVEELTAPKNRNRVLRERDENLIRAYEKYQPQLPGFLTRFREVHPLIAPYIGKSMGLGLQFIDGQMALDIVTHFAAKGILVLPVHDSFIIASQHETELREVMDRVYSAHNGGFKCRVDKK